MEDDGRKSRLIMVGWIISLVLGVVACAFFVIQGNARAEALRQEIKSNDEMIEKLGRDLSAAEERLANKADVDEDVVLSNATKTGQRIAELQDSFQTAKTDDRSDIAAKIVECVDSDSRSRAVCWYRGKSVHKWRFCSIFDFSGAEFECLWECRGNDDGKLYAYATATYDANAGVFKNLAYHMTAEGAKFIDTDDGVAIDQPMGIVSVNDLSESNGSEASGASVGGGNVA